MAAIESSNAPTNVAVIFGVTGLVGRELAKKLISKYQWKVYGIARRSEMYLFQNPNYHFISCDLLNPQDAEKKLSVLEDVTHAFWVTWANQYPLDSLECCEQNKKMMSNALNVVLPRAKALKHVSLQTGMKHYVSLKGPFEGKSVRLYDEECERVCEGSNFYYVLEDLLKDKLADRVAWSVMRPGLLMGISTKTSYNVLGSLCVYAAICKYLNLPFVFGGTRECWEEVFIDSSDSGQVAEQHIWAATNEEISSTGGQAFNAINGKSYTWKETWPALGKKLRIEVPQVMSTEDFWYKSSMSDKNGVWKEIVVKHALVQTQMDDLANWDFMDLLFRCPVKILGSRAKADRLGFTMKCDSLESIMYCIDTMRDEKLIP